MLPHLFSDALALRKLPRVKIDLRYREAASNDPFYASLVRQFYRESLARHPRYLVIPRFTVGVALFHLPDSYDTYFRCIEAAGRRNCKKAMRLGYDFRRIEHNHHLSEISAIRRSKEVRQGPMSEALLRGDVVPVSNPQTLNRIHDYPYFGVLRDGSLRAYAGCFICGEVCLLEHVFGHGDFESDGIVPRLYCGIVEYLLANHPEIRYFAYGTYMGAGETLRRFKRKFLFQPHNVDWDLGE
jgi:hypothetical protein